MKKITIVLVVMVLVVANISVDFGYSLQVSGYDMTASGQATFLQVDNRETIVVENGEMVSIDGKVSGILLRKAEGCGWLEIPVKSKSHIKVSVKKAEAAKAGPVMLFALVAIQRRNSSLDLLTAEIPVMFPGQFPASYKNNVKGWGNISKEELHSCLPDGTAKLLTMDLDIGDTCGLHCPHCFRRDPRFDNVSQENKLSHEEIVDYVREAKGLGLKEIKILGRGEPFQNPRFLEFLEKMTSLDISVAVFTKGHVLGNDELARRYNQHYGITSCWELTQRVEELKVSILLGFNSFDRRMQEAFTGLDALPETALLKSYVEFRDQALINLVKAGFNKYEEGHATRLAMIAAPVKPENINEIFGLYTWARVRNIYMLTCPTTVSGRGLDELELEKSFTDYVSHLEDLWSRIYVWAIDKNLIPLEVFKEEGVSLYPGCHVCNQTAAGFYLNLSGQVNQCPGRVDETTIFTRDIRREGLKNVWLSCASNKRAKHGKQFNYHCVARDGHSLTPDFYRKIEARVLTSARG